MYQYKARLKSSHEIIAEGHTVQEVENAVLSYRRGEKRGEHTQSNVPVEILHVKREQLKGTTHEDILKVI